MEPSDGEVWKKVGELNETECVLNAYWTADRMSGRDIAAYLGISVGMSRENERKRRQVWSIEHDWLRGRLCL